MPASIIHDTRSFKTGEEYKKYFNTKRSELGGMLGFFIRESSDENALTVTYEDSNNDIHHLRFFYLKDSSSDTKFFLQESRAESVIKSGLAKRISIQGDTVAASGAMFSIVQQCFPSERYNLLRATDHFVSARFIESSVAKMTKMLGQEKPGNFAAEVEEKSISILTIHPTDIAIDDLITKINTTMADFVTDSREYKQHVQAVKNLESDLKNNRLENNAYFIGRYNISTLFDASDDQSAENTTKMIVDHIGKKLGLPDGAKVLFIRSQDIRYVRVGIHADSLRMYFAEIDKREHQTPVVTHVSSNDLNNDDFQHPWRLMY